MGKEESAGTTGETEAGSETSEETTAEQSAKEKKEGVEKLRTVIKVNEEGPPAEETISKEKKEESPILTEGKKEETPKPTIPKVPKVPQAPAAPVDGFREDLEQRRNMLQSIKDFDFQIKKNQGDIGKMVEKLDGLTNDLDDLVSLYEIVSEQMNPFVGLSKVTKKRIDALENFTQEIEAIKTRMEDVESSVEKGVGGIKRLTKKIDTKEPAPDFSETAEKLELELEKQDVTIDDVSDDDLDIILNKSLESLLAEQNIDYMINEFLLSLK